MRRSSRPTVSPGRRRMVIDHPVRVVHPPDDEPRSWSAADPWSGGADPKGSLGAAVLADLQLRREDPYSPASLARDALREDPTDPAAMSVDLPDWDPDEPDPDDEGFVDEVYGRAATPAGLKGGARLKAYWTTGPGLAKWVASAHPWTALYRHLRKYMPARKAKATAAAWFHAVKGYWPGHQKGKNPVGPG